MIPAFVATGMGFLITLMLAPHMFVVSTFIENAQASIEQTLEFTQRPPLSGEVWPGGDHSPNPTMLLQTWRYNGSHNSGRDPRLAPLTCRMYHVCQFADGSVLFPEAYRGIERIVRACGVEKYIFARQASPDTTFDHSHAMNDLVAPLVPPRSTTHMEQLLHFSQIIFGQHISNEQWSSETVDYRQYNGSGDVVDVHGRVDENIAPPLRPLLYSRVESLEDESDDEGSERKMTWESLVMDKFEKSMEGFEVHRIDEAFPSRADSNGDASTAEKPLTVCYHSVMSTGERGDELPSRWLGPTNPFFSRNGIERHTRWLRRPDTSNENPRSGHENTTREATIVPRPDDGNLNILFIRDGLRAADLDSIEQSIQKRLRKVATSKKGLHLSALRFGASADVGLLYLEFQRADVVVAARSAVLNNVLYMRTSSVLLEIFPFSAADDTYGKVATSLGVAHVAIMAKADTKTFKKCIDSDSTVPDQTKERLMRAWSQASKRFSGGNRGSHLGLNSPRSQWRQEVPSAFSCAARQKWLHLVNTDAVLRAIFDRAVVPRL